MSAKEKLLEVIRQGLDYIGQDLVINREAFDEALRLEHKLSMKYRFVMPPPDLEVLRQTFRYAVGVRIIELSPEYKPEKVRGLPLYVTRKFAMININSLLEKVPSPESRLIMHSYNKFTENNYFDEDPLGLLTYYPRIGPPTTPPPAPAPAPAPARRMKKLFPPVQVQHRQPVSGGAGGPTTRQIAKSRSPSPDNERKQSEAPAPAPAPARRTPAERLADKQRGRSATTMEDSFAEEHFKPKFKEGGLVVSRRKKASSKKKSKKK